MHKLLEICLIRKANKKDSKKNINYFKIIVIFATLYCS